MKSLVTGATGHLGANLVRRLVADGHAVRALVRAKGAADEAALEGRELAGVERVYGDVRDPEAMRAAAAGVDRVFHTAAKVSTLPGEEREIFETNVVGTRNVLRAAREGGAKRVVVTGSLSAVGHHPERAVNEGDAFYPFDLHMPYARSKAWVEHECLKAAVRGQEVVVATSCAILGPNDFFPSRMGKLILDYANGKLRAYIPGGFDFVSAADLVSGHLLAMEKGESGQRYILSTRFLEVDELMEILERVTGRPRPRLRLHPKVMLGIAHVSSAVLTTFFPKVPQRFTPQAVRFLQMRRRADTSRAQRELGYRPTSIEDAIREAYEHFVVRGLIADPRVPLRSATPPPPHANGVRHQSVGASS